MPSYNTLSKMWKVKPSFESKTPRFCIVRSHLWLGYLALKQIISPLLSSSNLQDSSYASAISILEFFQRQTKSRKTVCCQHRSYMIEIITAPKQQYRGQGNLIKRLTQRFEKCRECTPVSQPLICLKNHLNQID